MNQKFYDFNTWIIRRKDGSVVSKKGIERENEKIRDIEFNWSINMKIGGIKLYLN